MEATGARIIHHPALVPKEERVTQDEVSARQFSEDVEAAPSGTPESRQPPDPSGSRADILTTLAESGVKEARIRAERSRVLGEINVLRAENRWEDVLALFHPVEQKVPDLEELGLATPVRAEMAFALCHLSRYDEAIALYQHCLAEEPDSFHFHSGLAYTAYDSLYAAKGRQIMLHPAERKARIELAHRHFAAAQSLRPRQVTNYYRQGMLLNKIQCRKDEALPLFETAVRNWEGYGADERKARHQERKNYVKALYQLASCQLHGQKPSQALVTLNRCLQEDEESGHFSAVHKYFALGKVHFSLGDLPKALHALAFAAAQANPDDDDFVFELLARVHLCQGSTDQAWDALQRVPLKRRRPYFRWTEADVLIARGEWDRARRTLMEAAERDRRGRHKALIRLARLEFRLERYEPCLKWAGEADRFFQSQFQNSCGDGLFWQAAALLRLNRLSEAARFARELGECLPHYPHLGKLHRLIEEAQVPERS
jgi:tetratricopeptide (TPR) repeat protein